MTDDRHDCGCCCCVGPQGVQGAQGMMGPQGPQGLQGVAGKDCNPECCKHVYCGVYSNSDQVLTPNGSVDDFAIFDLVEQVTSLDFDLSQAATLGVIKFLNPGVYRLSWGTNGMLNPPFPAPVPSWGLGCYLNGVLVGGSTVAGFSQSPDDDATDLSIVFFAKVNAGDTVKIKNISTFAIFLKSLHPELVAPMTSTYFTAIKIS
jgi:hypothetical protein